MKKPNGQSGISRYKILLSISITGAILGGALLIGALKNYIKTNQKNVADDLAPTEVIRKPKTNEYDDAAKLRDTQRQLEIEALHSALTTYKNAHGRYPTIQDMNSDSFRTHHFGSIEIGGFADPLDDDTIPKIVGGPQKEVYVYDVKATDKSSCNNIEENCMKYTLTAFLENGEKFIRLGE